MEALLKDHLNKLHSFEAIARLGSLRQAAAHLRISQPSLTHSMHVLEEAAGVPLLRRSVKGVEPTPAGQLLLEFSRKMLSEVASLQERLRAPSDELAGALTVGTYESFAIQVWPSFMKKFVKAYPQIQLTLTSGSLDDLKRKLFDGRIQLLVAAAVGDISDARFVELYTDEFAFYASSNAKLPTRPASDVFVNTPLIQVPSESCYGLNIERILLQVGVRPNLTYRLDTFEAARAFVAEGVGISALPRMIAARALKSKSLKEIHPSFFKKPGFGSHRIGAYVPTANEENRLVKVGLQALIRAVHPPLIEEIQDRHPR